MKHLNSLLGFKSVKSIFEKTPRSAVWIGKNFFWIEDCIEKVDGIWEGTLVNYIKGTDGFVREEERVSFTPPQLDPHSLIQGGDWGHDDLRAYTTAIEEHVMQCSDCENRMKRSSGAVLLPKLRAKITVQFPVPKSHHEHITQLQQLKPGQCLSCGCMVLDIKWTRQQAAEAFYKALAEVMQVTEDIATRVEGPTKLLDLPLVTKSLRRLRDKFWLPDGSLGSAEGRDAEEGDKVRQLPETIGEFINQILSLHSGMSYTECSEHWTP
ncbi:MAG: hypothetical protein Q7S32_01980 [bacterium]|nr:hypothetical protein [bacterium]